MYERFTDRARKVMQYANQAAQRHNHEYIGTEHVLIGLAEEHAGIAANILNKIGLHKAKILEEVAARIQPGPDMVTMGKLPQTPRAKKVIEYAMQEARNLAHNYVGTEHIFLGLVREPEGVAGEILKKYITLEKAREECLNYLGVTPNMTLPEAIKKLQESNPSQTGEGLNKLIDVCQKLAQIVTQYRNLDAQADLALREYDAIMGPPKEPVIHQVVITLETNKKD